MEYIYAVQSINEIARERDLSVNLILDTFRNARDYSNVSKLNWTATEREACEVILEHREPA